MKRTLLLLSISAVVGFTMFSTTSCKKTDSSPTMTLYDTLGGTTMVTDPTNTSIKIEKGRLGIRSVVDSTIFVIAADTAINSYFTVLLAEVTANNLTGFNALSKNLTDFFCVATGAKNFTYAGKSMTDAHNPATNSRMSAKADSGDFDAFVADLVKGAQKNGLSSDIINRIGAIVNTLRSQVVQK
ncbi:MAG: group 1 truncated hemoglobin [Bacteroidota bacterium]